MKPLYFILLPTCLFAQRFHLEQYSILSIEYTPIALLHVSNHEYQISSDRPIDAGLGILNPSLDFGQSELFITLSKHEHRDLFAQLETPTVLGVSIEAMPSSNHSGLVASNGNIILNSIGQSIMSLREGCVTGYKPGDGVPLHLSFKGGELYENLSAGIHMINLRYEAL